jgi:hypothetical protein
MMYRVMLQDGYVYPGLEPDGDAPEDTGEVYTSRKTALAGALDVLREVFRAERTETVSVNRRALAELWKECRDALKETGETTLTLPAREDDGEETTEVGSRFIAVTIERQERAT